MAAKLNRQNLIQSAISSFILKQVIYHLQSLFQTSTSLTLTYGGLLFARNGHQMLISALEKGHSAYAQSKGANRKLLCISKRLYRSHKKILKVLYSAEQNQILKVEQNHNATASNTNVSIFWKSAQFFFSLLFPSPFIF